MRIYLHDFLHLACLLALTVRIDAQCNIPLAWKFNNIQTSVEQAWSVDIKELTNNPVVKWNLIAFSETPSDDIFVDLSSNTQYTCLESRVDADGYTMVLYQHPDSRKMCFHGQVSNKALFYRKSVESTTIANIDECALQTGIVGAAFKVLLRMLNTDWQNDVTFETIPNGVYLMSYRAGNQQWACQDTVLSNLIKTTNDFIVNSTCAGSKTDMSYSNPLVQKLIFTDSITDASLGIGTKSTSSGFLVLHTHSNGIMTVPVNVYIVRYDIVNGVFEMFMETKPTDNVPRGYSSVTMVPTNNNVITLGLKTTLCSATSYCENGGACVPGFKEATCTCTSNYEGIRCQTLIDKCSPNPCMNNAGCRAITTGNGFECVCGTGFVGDLCESVDLCTGVGAVVCQNGATCHTYKNQANQDTPHCQCAGAYSGDRCQTLDPCAAIPCQNNGVCWRKNDATTAADYRCSCVTGFYGTTCEMVGPGPCANTPCQNGGACVVVGTNFVCNCLNGFTGTTCQSGGAGDTCSVNPCQNDGECMKVGDGVYCECPNTYSGAFCEEFEDWFIIMLVMVILTSIIFFIILIICACYCCCGWRPGSKKTPYQAYSDFQIPQQTFPYPNVPAEPMTNTIQFNFIPPSPYVGISPQ